MPWVEFSSDFDFKPKPSVTQSFKAGERKLVTSACAEAAEAAGKGRKVKKNAGDQS